MAARRAASHRQPTAGHDRRQIRRRVLQSPGWDRVHVYYSYQHEDSDFLVGDTVIPGSPAVCGGEKADVRQNPLEVVIQKRTGPPLYRGRACHLY